MAEITPLGVTVTGHPTDIKGAVGEVNVRILLEDMYNEFLDYKQIGKLPLDATFEGYIGRAIYALENHWPKHLFEQKMSGQIGEIEYKVLCELRVKNIAALKSSDPKSLGFDNYGIAYIQPNQRNLYKEKVGKPELLTPNERPVSIKTTTGNGILKPS